MRLDGRKSGQSYFLAPHVTLPWLAGTDARQYKIQGAVLRTEKLAQPATQEEIQNRAFSEAKQSRPGGEKRAGHVESASP